MEPESCMCRRSDVRIFGDFQICLACGASTRLNNTVSSPSLEPPCSADTPHTSLEIERLQRVTNHGDGLTTEAGIQAATNEYTHTQLNLEHGKHIRLIRLYPGNFDDELICQIYHANLDDSLNYEAISYTWADESGDRSTSKSLRCPQKVLHITPNCAQALRRARSRGFMRTLWIDSICIQQKNIKERNHQVSVMNKIYAGASQVLIYADEPSACSDELLDYIGDLKQPRHRYVEAGAGAPFHFGEMLLVIDELLSRAWFHRVWVLQEVILAKRALFIIGDKTVDWSLLSKQRLAVLGIRPTLKDGLVPGIFQWLSHQESKIDLLFALHVGRNCLASDARDKVFALIGLLNGPVNEYIEPNYNRSITEVFIQTAAFLIMSRNSLDVLSHVTGERSSFGLPSWVPDWSLKTYVQPLKSQFTIPRNSFRHMQWQCNGLELQPAVTKPTNPTSETLASLHSLSVLAVMGVKLDTVLEVIDAYYLGRIVNFDPQYNYGWVDLKNVTYSNTSCLAKVQFFPRITGGRGMLLTSRDPSFNLKVYPPLFTSNRFCRCGGHSCRADNSESNNWIATTTYDEEALVSFEREWDSQGSHHR